MGIQPRPHTHPGHHRVRYVAAALSLLLLASACGGDDRKAEPSTVPGPQASIPVVSATPGTEQTTGTAPPQTAVPRATAVLRANTPKPASRLADARVKLTGILEIPQPTSMMPGPGNRLWITLKSGKVIEFDNGSTRQLLDISSEVSSGGERGLLGLAMPSNRLWVYLNLTNLDGDTEIREYKIAANGIDPNSKRLVMKIEQPYANHNGGDLHFGPDGYLYIGTGDGGSAGDPQQNAQNLKSLLGKMLRIVPRPGGSAPYGVPSDNPFVGRADASPEIFHYGLRNPYRFDFDPASGDMWIGDVGQDRWEEVDWSPSGNKAENFGWDRLEGTHTFEGQAPAKHTLPVYEYGHDQGACSITGGNVYRGRAVPELEGAYLYADYCEGKVRAFSFDDGQVRGSRYLNLSVPNPVDFATDANGEMYVLSLDGSIWRIDRA